MRVEIGAVLVLGVILANCLALGIQIQTTVGKLQSSTSLPVVRVEPSNTTDPTMGPSENFTIAVRILNVTDLVGLDIRMSWNASILNYTSHAVKIPVEVYPDGVLHQPILQLKDEVNATAGTYWIAFATLTGPSFNGSGIVFEMAFSVIGFGECLLDIQSDLSRPGAQPIEHLVEDGYFNNTFYDVAILNVIPSTTAAFVGEVVNITVLVLNNGTNRPESFSVTVFYQDVLIDSQAVSGLLPSAEETLTFPWNTTGLSPGDYTLTANASVVQNESNSQNNRFQDGNVTLVLEPIHDVAILSLTPFKTLVFEGFCFHVNVTVENQGLFAEAFNVTLHANSTQIGELEIALNAGESQTLMLIWDTVGAVYGSYVMNVTASQVYGENDTDDNRLSFASVSVMHPGDFDMDRDVDIYDIVLLASAYNTAKGDPDYDAIFDVDCSDRVDIYDVVMITPFYGYEEPLT